MRNILFGTIKDIWAYRFALLNLILKDFRVRYRNMSLGILWSVLNPLVILGVLTFVFTYIYPSEEEHFAVFVLLGLVAYNFFSLCLSAATPSILVDNASLIKKVSFPRVIIPISVVFSQVIHVFIQLCLLGLCILVFRVPITRYYLWLPVLYFIELLFVLGISLICSSLCVFFRDMRYLVESGLTILFWVTPIFYSLGVVHVKVPRVIYGCYLCNPLAGCIEAARRAVIHAAHPDAVSLGMATLIAVGALFGGILLFGRLQRDLADSV